MAKLTIIGSGQIARALAIADKNRPQIIRGREILGHVTDRISPESTLVVHATGPAGDQASCENPTRAFAMHYSLVRELAIWLETNPHARLILIGTVAPNTGFYGPLKRAGIEHAVSLATRGGYWNRLLVLESGHIIGAGLSVSSAMSGVVARFIRAAVAGTQLIIAGNGEQMIRYTPLDDLTNLILAVGRNWPKVRRISPVSGPIRVIDVARICLRLANLAFKINKGVIVHSQAEQPESYEEPTGESFQVQEFTDVIFQWMRTMEVKILI